MKKEAKARRETFKGIVVILAILLVLGGTLFVRYQHLKGQYRANAETIEVLEEKKAQEEERTERLQQQEAYQQTDAYIEETARKLLNLIMPGDTAIKPEGE